VQVLERDFDGERDHIGSAERDAEDFFRLLM
jgi:hypothetical protein